MMRRGRRSRSLRRGFALIDLVMTSFVIVLVLAILVHFVQHARIKARAIGCRNNLRQIGVALAQYADAHGMLPPVEVTGDNFQLAHAPHALLLPYLPGTADIHYDPARPWYEQPKGTGAATIPVFRCPAAAHRDPVDAFQARLTNCPIGSLLGTTDYILVKGPNDSWCMKKGISSVPLEERGAFEIGRPVRLADIVDGLSQTMVFGEGTAGVRWRTVSYAPIERPPGEIEGGWPPQSYNFWCWPFLNTMAQQVSLSTVGTSLWGTTAVTMNRFRVVETLVSTTMLGDCRPEHRDQTGHAVSGFRSDHIGGSYFLFADGSTRLVSDDIEVATYKALSTIAGGESVQYVE